MIETWIRSLLSEYGTVLSLNLKEDLIYVSLVMPVFTSSVNAEMQSRLKGYGYDIGAMFLSNVLTENGKSDRVDLVLHPVHRQRSWMLEPDYFSPTEQRRKWNQHPLLHAGLFLITFMVVFMTGAATIINRSLMDEWNWSIGLQYTFALLGILTAHEFGHYLAARRHGLKVTLPYFLPGILIPPGIVAGFGGTTIMPGTFGAFIRIQSPIRNRRQLMDIGVAGPLAGFVVTLIVLALGILFLPPRDYAYQFYDVNNLYNGEPVLHFGNSLLYFFIGQWIAPAHFPPMYDIIHYPLLFAGWFGLLVTALNLLPIGQLDGGHVLYALVGRKQQYVAMAAFAGIVLMALLLDIASWYIWALLILFIIRIKHPPVQDEDIPLDNGRILIGILAILIFILCFIPAPVYDKVLRLVN